MDAVRLFSVLRPHLVACNARWALAGGFAVVALGSPRTTYDLDLVVDEGARAELLARLSREGFEVLFDSEGFTNLQHPDRELGRLDLIWLIGSTSERMFAAAAERPAPDGLPVLIPKPEHLVAMKVRAIQNRATRALRDAPDLQFLLGLPEIDENEARGYFQQAGLSELFDRIKASS